MALAASSVHMDLGTGPYFAGAGTEHLLEGSGDVEKGGSIGEGLAAHLHGGHASDAESEDLDAVD